MAALPSYDDFLRQQARAGRLGPIATVLLFLAVFAALQWGWGQARGSFLERMVIDQATVRPAAFLINAMDGQARARADGTRIRSPSGGINILNGCEGTEAVFLLAGAFAVASLAWRAKVSGLLWGMLLVYALNQVRIVALFYAWRGNRDWFDLLHGYVAPTMLVMLVAAYFHAWQKLHAARPSGA